MQKIQKEKSEFDADDDEFNVWGLNKCAEVAQGCLCGEFEGAATGMLSDVRKL